MIKNNYSSSDTATLQEGNNVNAQRAFWAAILFTSVALISFAFSFFLISRSPVWQSYTILAITALALLLDVIGLVYVLRGRSALGLRYFYWSLLLTIPPNALLVTNTTPILIAITLLVGFTHVFYLQPTAWRKVNQFGPIIVSILMAVVEVLQPPFRTNFTEQTTSSGYFGPVMLGFLVVSLFVLIVRQAWSRSFTLSRKLYIAFGIILALTIALAATGQVNLNRVQTSYEDTLAGGLLIQNLSDHLASELLGARQNDQDFLLNWQEEGYETAYQNYFIPAQQHITEMKADLSELSTSVTVIGRVQPENYSPNEYIVDIVSAQQSVLNYERALTKFVALIEERGFEDTGLEGELRRAVQEIEAKVENVEDPLTITMLQIRRHEKDYLLLGDQIYVDNVNDLIAQFKNQTLASEVLSDAEKTEIIGLADLYLTRFNELVEKDRQIAEANESFRVAATDLQITAEGFEALGEELANLDIQTAEENSRQSLLFTLALSAVVLIASIILAVFLSGQLTRPLVQLTTTAGEIAGGNFDVQAEVTSADEIGLLAQTFNSMTKRLGEAFTDVNRRATELATVAEVSTATSTILDTKRLLQEVVDLTKERFNLYHSHIYLLDEAGQNLVLTAGAGEPGRIMSAEKRSIPLDREQSLVARAARERQGVTVNDVTQAPDFLPNPLLPETRSELAVPMIVGGNVIGVFDIQSDMTGRFGEADVNIQNTLAAQVATSIQNVRSFERSKKQADFESLVNTINQKIQRTSSIEDTLQTAVRELGTAIGAARVKAKIQPASGTASTEITATD